MSKPISKVKSSLKLRAQPKVGALTLKIGAKKYALPFEVRLLSSDTHVFVHIPPAAELMKISATGLVAVTSDADANAGVATFKRARRRSTARTGARKQPELPKDVAEALSKLPKGYRLSYSADGTPKMIKTRQRRKS